MPEDELIIGPHTRFQLLDPVDDFDADDEADAKLDRLIARRRMHVSRGNGLSPTA